jgi:hypothetical protein
MKNTCRVFNGILLFDILPATRARLGQILRWIDKAGDVHPQGIGTRRRVHMGKNVSNVNRFLTISAKGVALGKDRGLATVGVGASELGPFRARDLYEPPEAIRSRAIKACVFSGRH